MSLSNDRAREALLLFAILLATAINGCKRSAQTEQKSPPPPEIPCAYPISRKVIDYREYTGRTAAIESVDIRARVSGYLLSIDFQEGKEVEKGDLLFRIDPGRYQQDLLQSEANLAAQQAQLERYEFDLERAKGLFNSKAISKAELDVAMANSNSARALLDSLKAAVSRAKLDLEYTEIRSPINGRTSRALVTPGNLVVEDSTILTSVVSMHPMYAYFDIDENSALDYRQRVRASEVQSARDTPIDITLGLANEEGYPHSGQIDFVDNVTDAGTGNIQVRGLFANPEGALLPGLFCRIRVPFTREYEALLVPQAALAMNQQGRYLLVVNEKKIVELHVVEVGTTHDERVVIRSGIGPRDRIVVEGLQKARPGSVVEPIIQAKNNGEAISDDQDRPPQ